VSEDEFQKLIKADEDFERDFMEDFEKLEQLADNSPNLEANDPKILDWLMGK